MSHQIVWFDIPATDIERAAGFYRAVLEVEIQIDHWEGGGLGVFPMQEGEVSGCIFQTPDATPGKTGPLLYLNVDGRLAEAVRAVEANGGEVLEPPHSIQPHGHRAVVVDSEGNRVALHSG